ncbi:MAG: fasciclin domain-containing protein [Bacteroidales bacterium]|nr:fasciclin domain-containing protein [Bacteroidales bacterium]
MKKILYTIWCLSSVLLVSAFGFSSCDDDPDAENYYTFTGEMMSDYLTSRPEYSEFAQIVDRAGLMDLLSAYGHFTCFLPNNTAMDSFLAAKGKTMESLTVLDCDTIARTHLVNMIYSTYEMKEGTLATQNMMRRPITVKATTDDDGNAVIMLNNASIIYFETQNDSVENGIVQPISEVLESSTNTLPDLIELNPRVTLFSRALGETGLADEMRLYKDPDYVNPEIMITYKSGAEPEEAAKSPDDRLYGYTAFLVPDSVLFVKYPTLMGENKSSQENLKGLYDLACQIYDPLYPQDVNAPGHSFENLSDSVNPLRRFIAYHILDRNCQGQLTVRNNFGFVTTLLNPNEWYTTMLPYSLLKLERLYVSQFLYGANAGDYYINRRCDNQFTVYGAHLITNVEAEYDNNSLNGFYYYVDDVLKFDATTREIVEGVRMRLDFSTLFPEVQSNDIRMNGDYSRSRESLEDSKNGRYGYNYWFPNGYLDGVTVNDNGYFVYRRPRQGYWSLHGDEFICQGDYDITFRIPPVPETGDWQIRLGYAAMVGVRGVAQIYFGEDPKNLIPQGIPLDMNKDLRKILYNSNSTWYNYNDLSAEKRQENRKTLKNLGYYYGCNGGYRDNSFSNRFADIYATLRVVLYTGHIEAGKDYYIRIRAVSSKQGNNNEAMLDYLELVPKQVYGVVEDGEEEDDL